ncbi:MAG: cobalt-precorrin-5B (C(1))-methyltransferase CbiD [Lachnospiraceae bacterium]|nr:cobalt-precorrin-5B (C(1))-methyltransferase CbiD [Lachnospiraceae bacterium]
MRYGFTTGSCAAAAAKAAAYMLLTGQAKDRITIETPKGIKYDTAILDIRRKENEVSCAVEKDGGDDPDITTGAWVYAKVSYAAPLSCTERETCGESVEQRIRIEGGAGVGRVTRKGLDQPVGNAAINHVPREMIQKEVAEVCKLADYEGGLTVEISVPEGEKLAVRTFNPRLGIVGGISILGTSGIVEPMSNQAILDTIRVELRQRREEGFDYVAVSPGNYGLDFMKKKYGYDLDRSVKCSNFIGETIDMAVELGFRRMLLTGHIGKLIKVAGGIMNTHSREADCRMELLAAFCVREQVEMSQVCRILECVTTQEAIPILQASGKTQQVMDKVAERICYYTENRSGGKMETDCVLYANEFGELAKSRKAEKWFILLEQEQERRI